MPAPPPAPSASGRRSARALLGAHAGLLAAIASVTVLSGATGPAEVSLTESVRVIVGHLLPGMPWMSDGSITPLQDQAVWRFRLPRTLLAGLAGAGLALSGALMQAIVRNPLAEPYVLGVSAGASVGAVSVITLGWTAAAGLTLGTAAFLGALAATLAVYLLARRQGVLAPTRMVLSGVALGSLLSAVTSYLTLTTEAQNVFSVLFFLLGSVSAATMGSLVVPAAAVALVALFALTRTRALNALLVGDEAATALGVDVSRLRAQVMVAASLLTGAVVSVSGGIGFVGLVVPHTARILVGADHRRMLPVALLGGALFLMVADLLARTVAVPAEIPLGIVTAVVGAPFFLWLVRQGRAARVGMQR
ncbi:FecCD family ABC transporter permease [Allostreptomyces psammosilenae]|uniref:Iron complex transport system permease protein n=1 Tax=Allostreptomyces psammosilenae TaxID=1892865 RepID=A0A853A2E9_9ACTN|nr:iron ABC transporter permease [Allostreptomyces psammosilenae]NYI04692.1 iron complex transport system permease protein [Allostreptomyces psammosilenae]